MRFRFASVLALAALAMLVCGAARAQQPMPPGRFDYYLLALSWSPTFCAHHAADRDAAEECGKARGLVVHGLWPQNLHGPWPAFCRPVSAVPPRLAEHAGAFMPNVELIEHEWTKHGSCTTDTVDEYFAAIERAFAALHVPEALAHPDRPVVETADQVKAGLVALNTGLTPAAIAVRCTPDGAVSELRICLDRQLGFRPCGPDQTDSCPARLRFPPVAKSAPQ